MAGIQNFRISLRGFNREDVVNYIEYINNQHNAQVAQLNTQLQNANEALARALSQPKSDELEEKLQAAEARIQELEALLSQQTAPEKTGDELEAYRRAERAERSARERAAQIHEQANAVLADVTVRTEEAAAAMQALIGQVSDQLQITGEQLQGAVSALYAIRPEEE